MFFIVIIISRQQSIPNKLLPAEAATVELGSDVATEMEAGVEEQEEMGMILLILLGEDLGF